MKNIPTNNQAINTIKYWKEKGLTYKMISEELGCHITTVQGWMKGKPISARYRIKIGEYKADLKAAQYVPLKYSDM